MVKKACCENEVNLKLQPKEPGKEELHKDLVIKKCKVCGCRHFELEVDPLHAKVFTEPERYQVVR